MFKLTEEQQDIQNLVRRYAQEKIKPLADEIDKEGRFPKENIQGLTELGIMGLNIPESYGGTEMDEMCKVLAISEVAQCCASTAEILAVHLLVNDIILRQGSEEQKKIFLPEAAEGHLGAFALTEANAGTDAGGLQTKAVYKDGQFILNGAKCFISNMGPDEGDHIVVIALTDKEKGSHGGMTAFLLHRNMPGISIGKTECKMGIRGAAVSEVVFTDCAVPETAVLGKVGDGFKIAMSGLDGGRIGIAAQSLGIADRALQLAVKYSKERVQFHKPLAAKQGLQWYIADMATRLEAARGLVYRAAYTRMNGGDVSTIAAMAKYYASETAGFICDLSLQMHGGYGYMKDYEIERLYRDARILRIYEGTSEVQKMVIARNVLK
ncbi:acyl-CoA dehydrogenase family protein [uncultured Megasphaera sp.]|uniref:acyl-CoA dehydrogenase family protein n=1 Tax=uncultured Megasphaera sp. TaxID=165188 RepID=UPI002608F517|nr:acyl-CoA dehydrogenase family protein [uncultured Megasphaera sp.]